MDIDFVLKGQMSSCSGFYHLNTVIKHNISSIFMAVVLNTILNKLHFYRCSNVVVFLVSVFIKKVFIFPGMTFTYLLHVHYGDVYTVLE